MGRVYEGLQGMPCRTVAVKVIKPGVLSTAAAKRFEYEAQILGRLTHPGIARIYSLGMQPLPGGEVPYFVMEFIDDARSITAYATERSLSTQDRVSLFREACLAVAHGHQKGVIHRDLKPGNILVDGTGQPKIIDFGVARSTDGDVALTTMHTDIGQLVGTLAYMAPEQFDSSSDDLDVRVDVYSLGIVLYELLTGSPPYDFARRAVYEVARVVKEVEPKSRHRHDRREVPAEGTGPAVFKRRRARGRPWPLSPWRAHYRQSAESARCGRPAGPAAQAGGDGGGGHCGVAPPRDRGHLHLRHPRRTPATAG
jgi:serine/threonine protein kinase